MCAWVVEHNEVVFTDLPERPARWVTDANIMPSFWIYQQWHTVLRNHSASICIMYKLLVGVVSLSVFESTFVLVKLAMSGTSECPLYEVEKFPLLGGWKCISSTGPVEARLHWFSIQVPVLWPEHKCKSYWFWGHTPFGKNWMVWGLFRPKTLLQGIALVLAW